MKYKLNVEVAFTDKDDKELHYKVGDVIEVSEKRGKELLADDRKLVSLNEKIEDKSKKGKSNKDKTNEDENK